MSEFEPDVILLDLMMPTMNGFETLQAIKNQTSLDSKIIIFTNVVDKEKIEEAMN
ncbi:MAG: response regulator [Candidatus Peribacteria bacterium]|nr:response regulator [Candidatus Peribacteria bacterium]